MKKKCMCLLLSLVLLILCLPAQADISNFFLRTRYGQLLSYENIPFRYAIQVYGGFSMYSDDKLNQMWSNIALEEGDDEIYDFRYWLSPDNAYEFQVQVKEQTYDFFATEVANAPGYIALIEENMKAAGYFNIRQLHEGILRDTPEGQMLETAYAFSITTSSGNQMDIAVVYYDCYYEDIEYIFEVTAYNGDYETAQYLLDQMVQTVQITPAPTYY